MGTYNGARYIDQQIESLVSQTHADWRLLIRDDGSTDSTLETINRWMQRDDRVALLTDDLGNLGFNRNFHHLLQQSSSAYSMYCDQDDQWLPSKIERTLAAMQNIERSSPTLPVLVHSDSTVSDKDLQPTQARFVQHMACGRGLPSVLFVNPAQGSTIMMNAELRQLACRSTPVTHFDYHAVLIAAATGVRHFLDESLMLYRQHGNNALGAMPAAPTSPDAQPPGLEHIQRWIQPPFIPMGRAMLPRIEQTLAAVQDRWLDSTSTTLERHRQFLTPGFSVAKLTWLARFHYRFYARRQYLHAWLWALGLS